MTISEKYPIILGKTYWHCGDNQLAILIYADLNEDIIRLKCCDSPWVFESNYVTFSSYWRLK
jgi:hypothetical protein